MWKFSLDCAQKAHKNKFRFIEIDMIISTKSFVSLIQWILVNYQHVGQIL